jgi:hypothetical protein
MAAFRQLLDDFELVVLGPGSPLRFGRDDNTGEPPFLVIPDEPKARAGPQSKLKFSSFL